MEFKNARQAQTLLDMLFEQRVGLSRNAQMKCYIEMANKKR